MAYEVEVTDFLFEIVYFEHMLGKIENYFYLLADFPNIDRSYDPEHPAARPSFACRCIDASDTPLSLHYAKDDDLQKAFVFYLKYQGSNPMIGFADLD